MIKPTYVIREVDTGKMADVKNCQGACYEDQDGKERAEDLVATHNRLYPNKWKVVQETF